MPKSKRIRRVNLTAVKPKGRPAKEKLLNGLSEAIESYDKIFIFRAYNMRNQLLKEIRDQWKETGKIFMGKNSVMKLSLIQGGQEVKEGLKHVANALSGQCGLFFTNDATKTVLDWFASYSIPSFARSGHRSDRLIQLSAGPLPQDIAPFSLEPQLRKLGLPTRLVAGTVELTSPVTLCQVGDILTPEQCRLLQLFDHKIAEFRLKIIGVWTGKDGVYEQLESDAEKLSALEAERKEGRSYGKNSGIVELDDEVMEGVDTDDEENNENNNNGEIMKDNDEKMIENAFKTVPIPTPSSSSSSSSSVSSRPSRTSTRSTAASSTPYAAAVAAKKEAKSKAGKQPKAQKKGKGKKTTDAMDEEDME